MPFRDTVQKMADLFIVSAPSGCGKTSLVKALIKDTEDLCVSVSHTTRSARPGEVEGENYFFVSLKEFEAIQKKHGFIESAKVFGNHYGSTKQNVEDLLNQGLDVILEIDWQGARQVKKAFADAISIFILPPSQADLRLRLLGRGQDNDSIISRRMTEAVNEMQHYNEFDYLVINDKFETALNDLSLIIHARRLTLSQQSIKQRNLLKTLI